VNFAKIVKVNSEITELYPYRTKQTTNETPAMSVKLSELEPALDQLAEINNSRLQCQQMNTVIGQETEGSQLSENPWNNQQDKLNEATHR
jgi:hypothetical protein